MPRSGTDATYHAAATLVSPRVRHACVILIGLALFAAALDVLRLELSAVTWPELSADLLNTPLPTLALAAGLTVVNYAALAGYDLLAFASIGKTLPRMRIMWAAFLAYAISHNVGFALLSGTSIRYRFYTRWGVTAEQLSRIVFSYSVTFWLGLLTLGGLSLALSPPPPYSGIPLVALAVPVGCLLMTVAPAYLLVSLARDAPLRVRDLVLPLPSPGIAAAQVLISSIDWALAGAVLFVLLPPSQLTFLTFLGAFLAAALLGMVSHVPGGVGVFEGLMVLLLRPYLPSASLLPALVVYRAVYYVVPLIVALVGLVADEAWLRRTRVMTTIAVAGRLTARLTPRILALCTFLAGLLLLFSGATPAAEGRLALLNRFVPIGVIEASHFLASIAGTALLILSQGLARRLDAAYYLTSLVIVAGMSASMLKGFDYEEAALLLAVLFVLRRARAAFDRRAAFFDTRFSTGWIVALAGALVTSVWLGLFAFKHVDYSRELWWQFELGAEASRFLRASIGAAVALLMFGLARLIGFAPHPSLPPTAADLVDAAAAIQAQTSAYPFLAYLGDKSLLFNADRTGFIMFAVHGRTWVALGDPVGPSHVLPDLIRLFIERCDDYGGVPVFYEIGAQHMHLYADFGFTFAKLGEEARVDLTTFTLEGSGAARYRQVIRRLAKDACTFRIVASGDAQPVMARLRAVSDDWLAAKGSAEKGFSLGFFAAAYLERFPIAVIERAGEIVAFANLWLGPGCREMSVDLMRYHRDAPTGVMEALFVHLMKWGREQGYQQFTLGMAPLSGFERSPFAPLWQRMGAFVYEHGETVYHFQGLRAYKNKFNPTWVPHYLAYPGGLRLPLILADVSALIAGGYRRIFRK